MGVVFRAYDSVTRRYVAVKTLRAGVDRADLELFEKEWSVLARISHPNIVDILDTGEFSEDGQTKPFFVMPLLPGSALDKLIAERSPRLTVERTIEILVQACRGLQAAHDQGLVHRDMKPSNIFVMDDDTVKIIDFGVVHLSDTRSFTGIKGTLDYMAPEQLQLKASTPQSDIFSLGVVTYEALTGQRPFAEFSGSELIEAIRNHIARPAGDLNPNVNQLLSRTVHKAMAKQPFHRFTSAREFADTLQKAVRNQPIERFDRSQVQPRIDRIKKAYQDGDPQFAHDILTELESEGHLEPEMPILRLQIDQQMRQMTIRQLLDSARTRFEEEEYPLALQKVQEVLEMDAANMEAITIRSKIEKHRSEKQLGTWFQHIRQQMEAGNFSQARQGIDEVFRISPSEVRGRELLREIDRREQEADRIRAEKEQLYDSALASYRTGEVSTALNQLERALSLVRRIPSGLAGERDAQYQSLYEEIREQQQRAQSLYAEARERLNQRDYAKAISICEGHLSRNGSDTLFYALKLEAEEQERQEQSAAVADVTRRVEAEPDLDRKVSILQEASERYPKEPNFNHALKLIRDRRDLVNTIVARASEYEQRGQLSEAIAQWEIIRSVHRAYGPLARELARLEQRRRDRERDQQKAAHAEEFDRRLITGDYAGAQQVADQALAEFPGDQELEGLRKLAEQGIQRAREAQELFGEGRRLIDQRDFEAGIEKLRQAEQRDSRNATIHAALVGALVEHARALLAESWQAAEPVLAEARQLDAQDPAVRALTIQLDKEKARATVAEAVLEARRLQAEGQPGAALELVSRVAADHPREVKLMQLQDTLQATLGITATASKAAVTSETASTEVITPAERHSSPARFEAMTEVATAGTPAARAASRQAVVSGPPERRDGPDIAADGAVGPPASPTAPAETGRSGRSWRPPLWMLAAGGLLFFLAGAFGVYRLIGSKPAALSTETAVEVRANVAGASLQVDGKPVGASFRTGPGEHHLTAKLDGYRPATVNFLAPNKPTGTQSIAVALEPAPAELRITSDLKAGKVFVDAVSADLEDGIFVKNDLPPGEHQVRIWANGKDLVGFKIRAEPAKAAVLVGAVEAKGVPTLVISTFSKSARLWATPGLKGGGDEANLQVIPPEGVAFEGLGAAENKFVLDDGKSRRRIDLESSTVPLISVSLGAPLEAGTIVVQANVAAAAVLVNGVALKKSLANGTMMMTLAPRLYTIRLHQDGYKDSEQTVDLKNGDSKTLRFELAEIEHRGTLAFEKFPPDTEVVVDGKSAGSTASDGTFHADLAAGSHTLTFRKSGYEDLNLSKDVKADAVTEVTGEGMTGVAGTIALKVTPAAAQVTYQREGETQAHEAANGQTLSLRPGNYELTATAEKRETKSQMVTVQPGKGVVVDWLLPAAEVRETNNGRTPANTLQDPKAWTIQEGWWEHTAPGDGWFAINQGSFTFDILKQSTKKLFGARAKRVEWLADYQDEKNYVLYTLDDHQLRRRAYVNGAGGVEAKAVLGADSLKIWRIGIDITNERILIRNAEGKPLDEYKRPKPEAGLGKFGFRGWAALSIAGLR
jgi:serine/threonine protein kinase